MVSQDQLNTDDMELNMPLEDTLYKKNIFDFGGKTKGGSQI